MKKSRIETKPHITTNRYTGTHLVATTRGLHLEQGPLDNQQTFMTAMAAANVLLLAKSTEPLVFDALVWRLKNHFSLV